MSSNPQLLQYKPPTPEQIAAYRRDGFVRITQALSPELVEGYRRSCTEVVRAADERRRRQLFLEDYNEVQREAVVRALRLPAETDSSQVSDTYAQAFTQITNLWRCSPAIRELVFSPRLAQMAAALMQVDAVRVYHDQALFKEAGGGHTPWHVDQFYWPLSSANTVTLWIPLQAVSMEMGPLVFAQGSHRSARDSIACRLAISDESETELARLMADYPQPEAPFEMGEVSFHSGWTCHRAGPNRTGATRAAFTIIYMDADNRMIEPEHRNHAIDAALWLPGVMPGEVAASALNPQVYPPPD